MSENAEIDALASALQRHDPEPYFPGNFEEVRYYREYAAAILATGLRVVPVDACACGSVCGGEPESPACPNADRSPQ